MFVTYSVLSWISFVLVCVTLTLYATQIRFWQWPSRMILFGGYGLFWMHLSAIGSVFYSYSDLQCADEWSFQYYSWCKFSSWALIYGSMQTACWWLIQTVVVTWTLSVKRNPQSMKQFEPLIHAFCWSFPLISAFTNTFVPDSKASGGGPGGLPFCGDPGLSAWVWFGLYIGPLCLFLLIVLCCFIFSIIQVIRTVAGKETKEPSKYASILFFSFIFVNVIVSLLTQSFWVVGNSDSIGYSAAAFTTCLITTLNRLDACNMYATGNLSIYWYFTISLATTGIGYAIVFISLYIRIFRLERNIIDPERMIAKKSGQISQTGSTLD